MRWEGNCGGRVGSGQGRWGKGGRKAGSGQEGAAGGGAISDGRPGTPAPMSSK